MNYNTDLHLWENELLAREKARRPQIYHVENGMVSNGMHVIARFSSQEDAIATISAAGWVVSINSICAEASSH